MTHRLLLLLGILAGCGGEAADPHSKQVQSVEPNWVSRSPSHLSPSRDSIIKVFREQPKLVLEQMKPETDPMDVHIALALLESSQGEAKLRFAHYLAMQGERGVPAILSIVGESKDFQTLVAAIQTLGKLRSPLAISAISSHLQTPNDWVRMAAAHALGDIGGNAVVSTLVSTLEDTADTVVSAALIALGKAGEGGALSACVGVLHHDNPRVRAAAVSAISRLGSTREVSVLQSMLNDLDSGVRYKAQQGIDQLNHRGATP